MQIVNKTPVPVEEKNPKEDRIVLLSDGVFAIAMTLLILDIRLPEGLPHDPTFQYVLTTVLLPKFLSYVISFIVIARYWNIHRRIMRYLQRIDISFIQINLLLLFFITTLPIPTTFALQEPYSDGLHLTTILYTISIALSGFTLAALWMNATWKHRLVEPNLEQDIINYFLVRLFVVPIFFILSLLLLLIPHINPNAIYFSWLLVYVIFLLLRRLQPRLFPKVTEHFEHNL